MPMGDVLRSCGGADPSAWMLSDQCGMSIRMIRQGEVTEWHGCILEQMLDAMAALEEFNPTVRLRRRSEFTNMFPRPAVREALVNAAIHCAATPGCSIDISIGDSVMTVSSPGRSTFRPGGRMVPRNGALASAMASMGWAELRARGLLAIGDAYRRTWCIPRAEDRGDGFVVTLPALTPDSKELDAVMGRVVRLLAEDPGLTVGGICRALMISQPAASLAIRRLEAEGRIFTMGPEGSKRYYQTNGNICIQH